MLEIKEPCENQIADLRKLWKEAFGDTDDFLDDFFSTGFSKERCRCVIIDGEVVAALYWFSCEIKEEVKHSIAYIYAVATAKKFQGQGICHKLMEETHKNLKKCGYEGVILVPGNEGLFRFYKGIGYQTCSKIREFRCVREAQSISYKQISKSEYAKLRRHFLPEGGVIQEGVNLDFLETQAKFYAGEDFLLAACKEGDTLRGVELLGDITSAPAIVWKLGYKEGYFRTPGIGDVYHTADTQRESKVFGMYYPLEKNTGIPKYFGLAFD